MVRCAVQRHQQPAAELLQNAMVAVARGRLRHLRHQRKRVAQQQPTQRLAGGERALQMNALHAVRMSRLLNNG